MRIRNGRDTPCVGVCNTLYVDVCQGCGRTAQEEANRSILDESEKSVVWDRIIKLGWRPGIGVLGVKE